MRWLTGSGIVIALALLATHVPDANGQGYSRTIPFSGYIWLVKTSSNRVGPGPNFFSDTEKNVWVDTSGRLHLKITRSRNRWYCAEVICTNSLGHGTYRFYLDNEVHNLDPNVVLGLFTWNDDPDFDHRELDVEFARWGSAANQNAQYVVQPYTAPENIYRYDQLPGVPQSTHSFLWTSTSARFLSLRGHAVFAGGDNLIAEKTFTQGVPPAGGENPRMNLWLFRGRAPANRQEVEVIIKAFEFEPASP